MRKIDQIPIGINFDEREAFKAVDALSSFKVWVNNVVNNDYYDTGLVTDLSYVKESDHEYTVIADVSGMQQIHLTLQNKAKTKTKLSNTLVVAVEDSASGSSARFNAVEDEMTVMDDSVTALSSITIVPLFPVINETFTIISVALGQFVVRRVVINALLGLTPNLPITWQIN